MKTVWKINKDELNVPSKSKMQLKRSLVILLEQKQKKYTTILFSCKTKKN